MPLNIAINGFGRIGRTFLRTILANPQALKNLNVKAINIGPSSPHDLDHLFKYDSLMGTLPNQITFADSTLTIDDQKITIIAQTDPQNIQWNKYDIDWVVDASGRFTQRKDASLHLTAGAKKVLITAPATDEDVTIIPGVNDAAYDTQKHVIVSLGSCTTNCFAPIVKVLLEAFGIKTGIMTTVHAYTASQMLLDGEHKDLRRARAAAINIIPTKTGAAQTILKIFPQLTGKLTASALRIPVPKVSILDFTFVASKPITVQSINDAFLQASKQPELKNILSYATAPLVSSDYNNSPYSVIFDSLLTQVTENTGQVFGWYDNEWGYCCRLVDFLLHNS